MGSLSLQTLYLLSISVLQWHCRSEHVSMYALALGSKHSCAPVQPHTAAGMLLDSQSRYKMSRMNKLMRMMMMMMMMMMTNHSLLSVAGLRGSLSRLQLDYVDIVFANRNDVNSPMEGQSQMFLLVFSFRRHVAATVVIWCGCKQLPWSDEQFKPDVILLWFAEIVRAMTFVINQGMAMYWGTSRWSAMEIMVNAKRPSRKAHSSQILCCQLVA